MPAAMTGQKRGYEALSSSAATADLKRPPPSTERALALARDMVAVLEGKDDEAKRVLKAELARAGHSITTRTAGEEQALRELVALADIKCWRGYGEVVRLDDVDIWASSDFVGRRRRALVPLQPAEVAEFLSDAFHNSQVGAEDDDVIISDSRPEDASGLPEGPSVVFRTPVAADELHPQLTEMLQVLKLPWVRFESAGRPSIAASVAVP